MLLLLSAATRRRVTFRACRQLLLYRRIGKGTHWSIYYSKLFPYEVLKVSTARGKFERQKYAASCREQALQIGYCEELLSSHLAVNGREIVFQKHYPTLLRAEIERLVASGSTERLDYLVEAHVKLTLRLWESGLIDFDPRYSNYAVSGEPGDVIAIDNDMLGSFRAMSRHDAYRLIKRFWAENWLTLGEYNFLLAQHAANLLQLKILTQVAGNSEICRMLVRLPVDMWFGELPLPLTRQIDSVISQLSSRWGE